MSLFDDAIDEGVWAGIVQGLHAHGLSHPDAEAFLARPTLDAETPKDRGIRRGLAKVGRLRQTWMGTFRRVEPK